MSTAQIPPIDANKVNAFINLPKHLSISFTKLGHDSSKAANVLALVERRRG